jgi:hypothetical protein
MMKALTAADIMGRRDFITILGGAAVYGAGVPLTWRQTLIPWLLAF